MNRRGFFNSLGVIIGAASAPTLFLPRIISPKWIVNPRSIPNPDFINIEMPFNPKDYLGKWVFVMDPDSKEFEL